MIHYGSIIFESAHYHLENVDNTEVISENSIKMLLKLGLTNMSRNKAMITCARASFLIKLQASGLQLY